VRIVDSQGTVVAEAKPSGNGLSADFQANRGERYFADVVPARTMAAQEVTLQTELIRNGELQELPSLRER
jgi:hypothetical protein